MRLAATHFFFFASILFSASGCNIWGSATGLLVPDIGPDAYDAIDTVDAVDIVDAPDVIEACVPGMYVLERRNSDVMFVIDRSGSMAWSLDGNFTMPPSRWTLLQGALATTLTDVQHSVRLGALFFPELVSDPSDITMVCGVPHAADVPIGLDNLNPILSVFMNTMPNGGTPTFDAVGVATSVLQSTGNPNDAKYIVLATDGGPNCDARLDYQTCVCTGTDMNGMETCSEDPMFGVYECLDDTRTVDGIRAAASSAGIPVYVIGIASLGDSVFVNVLNEMAIAGGRPNTAGATSFYSVSNPGDLTSAFTTIENSITQCQYGTPFTTDPDGIRIFLGGSPLPRDTTHMSGWDWTDEAAGAITLFGSACDQVVANPADPLTAEVGCDDGG